MPPTDPEFKKQLLETVDPSVGRAERHQLSRLIDEFRDVFSQSEYDLGQTGIVKHTIDTADHRPIKQGLRRHTPPHQQTIKEHTAMMMKQGLVEPASSEWAANVVLVKKKTGELRFYIDYGKLNEATKKDAYTLPRIEECLDAMSRARWFSTFDLRSGYHQVLVDPASSDKTTFISREGTFRFKVMPFALCNAPSTFQRLMDLVISGLKLEICLQRLRKIFERLRVAKLKLKPTKCKLLQRRVGFLGHVVSEEGIAMNPEKIKSGET